MTGNTDDIDDSEDRFISRRGVLGSVVKGIAGVGAGLGVGAGGILVLDRETDHIDLGRLVGPSPPDKTPSTTRPDDPTSPRDTPWNQDTVVFSIDRNDSLAGFDYVPVGLRNAVTFWNDYIEANEQFDLTLSFEPDASDPDVEFVEENIMHCSGEYRSPATGNEHLTPYVCVETLTDHPENTPITVDVSLGGGGDAVYELVATHALGRLVGYDVWSEPVDVMTPKILFGPTHHHDHPGGRTILATPSGGGMYSENFTDNVGDSADDLRSTGSEHIEDALQSIYEDVNWFVDDHRNTMDQWTTEVEDMGFPRYVEAYEETVLNDDIAYVEETLSRITDLVETDTAEEIVDSEGLDAIITRLEDISTWNETRDPFDLQIHRYWTDAVWTEWADDDD